MRSFARVVAAALLVASAMPVLRAQSSQAQRLYSDALERERALRHDFDAPAAAPSLLPRVRALVGAYEDMAKLFPTSGYADNALWQGGRLAGDAFWQFGDAMDRATALKLFSQLTSRFPSSPLARQSAEHTKRLAQAKAVPASQQALATDGAPTKPSQPPPAPPVAAPSISRSTTPAAAAAAASLTAIRREVLPEALRITLELGREVTFYDERIDGPPRVFIDLQNTRTAEDLNEAVIPFADDVVKQVRIGRQSDARTRVVLDLRSAGRYSIYTLYDPYRIVVDFERSSVPRDAVVARNTARPPPLSRTGGVQPKTSPPTTPLPQGAITRKTDTAVAPTVDTKVAVLTNDPTAPTLQAKVAPSSDTVLAPTGEAVIAPTIEAAPTPSAGPAPIGPTGNPAPLPPSTNRNGNFSLSRQLGLGIARIVIDAGHGGHDPGAQARGLTEAELTLDIALRLEKLLTKEAGFEVVLTRRTNTFVPLEERTAIANRAGADLFLSIHSNASSTAAASGIETYFLNFAPNPEAEAVAARENAGGTRTMRSLPEIVRAIALNNKIDESRDFASMVQLSMFAQMRKSNRDLRNLGVKQAPFLVLIGATMPSILAEVSFITNKQDATLLKTDKYRQQIAEALLAGVLRYQQSLKRVPAIATK
jgi:N-acetylmuramoyl-L-alanine amidase